MALHYWTLLWAEIGFSKMCLCVQEDLCWSNAREDYPVPEENQDREPLGANRRGQCGAASLSEQY